VTVRPDGNPGDQGHVQEAGAPRIDCKFNGIAVRDEKIPKDVPNRFLVIDHAERVIVQQGLVFPGIQEKRQVRRSASYFLESESLKRASDKLPNLVRFFFVCAGVTPQSSQWFALS